MIITVIVFILVIGVLVLVHELGHFTMAKLVGVRVEEFGLGMPPRVWGKRRGETVYSLNLLPFGGFVRLTGEDGQDRQDPRSFASRSTGERFLILAAGIVMNLLLAIVTFTVIFSLGVMVPDSVRIESVVPDSPAAKIGLLPGDQIVKMDGGEIKDGFQLITETAKKLGQEVTLVVLRNGKELTYKIVPRRDFPKDQGPMGVAIKTNFKKEVYPIWKAPFAGIKEALVLTRVMLESLGQMVVNLVKSGQVPQDITGPVGIAQLTGEAARSGPFILFQLLGLLSLNLAIVNALPLPALDGGRAFFVLTEIVTGRRPRPHFEQIIHTLGFAFLIVLIILITIHDLSRIRPVTHLVDSLKLLIP